MTEEKDRTKWTGSLFWQLLGMTDRIYQNNHRQHHGGDSTTRSIFGDSDIIMQQRDYLYTYNENYA